MQEFLFSGVTSFNSMSADFSQGSCLGLVLLGVNVMMMVFGVKWGHWPKQCGTWGESKRRIYRLLAKSQKNSTARTLLGDLSSKWLSHHTLFGSGRRLRLGGEEDSTIELSLEAVQPLAKARRDWLVAIFLPQWSFFMCVHHVMHDLAGPFSHLWKAVDSARCGS